MSKYVFAYHGGGMPETPEEQERVMAEWSAWFEAMGSAVIDGGNPVAESRTVAADGSVGPTEHGLSGYSLVEAADFDAALGHAKGCPILSGGGSVEVAETIDM